MESPSSGELRPLPWFPFTSILLDTLFLEKTSRAKFFFFENNNNNNTYFFSIRMIIEGRESRPIRASWIGERTKRDEKRFRIFIFFFTGKVGRTKKRLIFSYSFLRVNEMQADYNPLFIYL